MMTKPSKVTNKRPDAQPSEKPKLTVARIGIVSRNYAHPYKNGFRDFSYPLPRVLELLDNMRCDTVLFSSFSIIRPSSFRPTRHMRHLRYIKSVVYEEFTGWQFTKGKWKKASTNAKTQSIVLHRKGSGWNEHGFCQWFGSLNPPTKEKHQLISDFVSEELLKRILGNCCLLLCGETNGVKYSSADGRVQDKFHLRKAVPKSVGVILNPVHDRMTRFEMNLKRRFLSEHGRWVISVWNKGRKDRNGKVKDGAHPAWKIFRNGQEVLIDPIENDLGVEMGIVDIRAKITRG